MNHKDHDLKTLHFLWKWKVSTTSALANSIYPHISCKGAYSRLLNLTKSGLIRCDSDRTGKYHFWTLTKKGFQLVKPALPPLIEDGFESENKTHDLLVSAIHLGEGLFQEIPGLEYFTEQELRRYNPEFFPSWVPKSTRRTADGYWHIEEKSQTVALEVELSQKSLSAYKTIVFYYQAHPEVTSVIWVVSKPAIANKIQEAIRTGNAVKNKHNFVHLWDIYNDGWQSPIFDGEKKGRKLEELIRTGPRQYQGGCFSHVHLDMRKRADIATNYRFLIPNEISTDPRYTCVSDNTKKYATHA